MYAIRSYYARICRHRIAVYVEGPDAARARHGNVRPRVEGEGRDAVEPLLPFLAADRDGKPGNRVVVRYSYNFV